MYNTLYICFCNTLTLFHIESVCDSHEHSFILVNGRLHSADQCHYRK